MQFQVLSYNIYQNVDKPVRFTGQSERLARLKPILHNLIHTHALDAVVLIEVLNLVSRNGVAKMMRELGFPYFSRKIQGHVTISGGVFVFSKWPIAKSTYKTFGDVCKGVDCLASKGITYACVNKHSKHLVHIFATHLQAGIEESHHNVRQQQALEIQKFLEQREIPSTEPVILAGDLNIDMYTHRQFLNRFMTSVGLEVPPLAEDSIQFTLDPDNNKLVGSDTPDEYYSVDYPDGCVSEYYNTWTCVCCTPMMVDYVTYSYKHLIPTESNLTIIRAQTPEEFEISLTMNKKVHIQDVSDHYPVVGHFRFPEYASRTIEDVNTAGQPVYNSNSTTDGLLIATIVLISITLVFVMLFGLIKFWRYDYVSNTLKSKQSRKKIKSSKKIAS